MKKICMSCGVLRTTSITARAVPAASGLPDSRISAISKPSAEASTIDIDAHSTVLSEHTSSARP